MLNFFMDLKKKEDFSKSHGHSNLVIRYDSKNVFLFHQQKLPKYRIIIKIK